VKEADNVYVYNNYFENANIYNNEASLMMDYVSPWLNNINVMHNTFVNSGYIASTGATTTATSIKFADNIFLASSAVNKGQIFLDLNTFNGVSGSTFYGNIYYGGSLNIDPGVTGATGLVYKDPKLVYDADFGYYRLASDSPAIGASTGMDEHVLAITGLVYDSTVSMDISGQAVRPSSTTAKDVGAQEFSTMKASEASNRRLYIGDTGPSYLKACTPTYVANSNYAALNSITGSVGSSVNVVCNSGWVGGGSATCLSTLQFSVVTSCTVHKKLTLSFLHSSFSKSTLQFLSFLLFR
jgi:hypothetical protein